MASSSAWSSIAYSTTSRLPQALHLNGRPYTPVRSSGPVFSSRNLKAKDAGPKGQIPLAEVAAR